MKILHFIDSSYFSLHRKTISEIILSLNKNGVEQEVITSFGASLGLIESVVPVKYWKVSKKGKSDTFMNKFKMWLEASRFSPDILIKWGMEARRLAPSGDFVQISFLNEKESLKSFDKSDYIMTNLESVLEYAKQNGFSGAKSFYVPSFVCEYSGKPLDKRDFYMPEKSRIIYIAGNFLKNIGWEAMFEVVSSIQNTYFFIAGSGNEEEYIKDYASRVNMKARSRFIPDIDKSLSALQLSDFAILTFDDVELQKNILEAWLSKKLVLTVKTDISSEFIKDGVNGFVVPKNDTYFLRKKLKEIMEMPEEERAKIINNAFETAKNFVEAEVALNYIKVFEELILKYKSRKNLFNN
ncbi:glycosyltransferase [bacterium]|nr:glycosyltransferase [bacterium]